MSTLKIKTEKDFNELLKSEKVTIVDFYADWCGPCKALAPIFEKVSNNDKYKDINFVKIDIDNLKEIANRYNILSIPTMLFFKNNEKLPQQHIGLVNEKTIISSIESIQDNKK